MTIEVGPILGVLSEANEHVVLLVFPANSAIGEPVAGDDVTEVAWFPLDALPELAFDHDPQIIRLWQDWRRARHIPTA